MPTFVATSDFHFHDHKSFSSKKNRFEIQLDVLDQFITLAKDNKAVALFAGDLFHKRSYINVKIFNRVFDKIATSGINWVMVAGNHDSDSDTVHSLEPLGALPNVTLLHNSNTVVEGQKIYGVAPGQKPDLTLCEDAIVLAHGMLNGAVTPTGYAFTAGYNQADFSGAKLVLLGDIHKPQQHGSVWIPGCPLMLDFGDAGDAKSVLLIRNTKVERVELKAPQFFVLNVDTLSKDKIEAGDPYNYYRIDLAATATTKTEKLLREKFPNCVVTRQPRTREKKRVELTAQQDHRSMLASYFDYAKPVVDREAFIAKCCEFLSTGTKQAEKSGAARTFRFKRIWLENFMSFREASYEFSEGTYLVTATSDDGTADSNGCGKSVLLIDAIIFCLYGTLARAGLKSKDRVIHDPNHTGKGKNCAVGIELDIGPDSYEFIRARKHDKYGTSAAIRKNGQPCVFEDPEKEIEQILALPMEVLLNTAIFPQRTLRPNYKPFLACTDSERKEILETALSLGAFGVAGEQADAAYKVTAQQYDAVVQSVNFRQQSISAKQEVVDRLQQEMVQFKTQHAANLLACQQQLTALESQKVEVDLANWQTLQNEIAVSTQQLTAAQSTRKTKAEACNAAKINLDQIIAQLSLHSQVNITPGLLSPESLQQWRDELQTLEIALADKTQQWRELLQSAPQDPASQIADVQRQIKQIIDRRGPAGVQLRATATVCEELKNKLQQPLETCTACGQHVAGEAQARAKATLTQEVEKQNQLIQKYAEETKRLDSEVEILQTQLDTLVGQQQARQAAVKNMAERQQEIDKIKATADNHKRVIQASELATTKHQERLAKGSALAGGAQQCEKVYQESILAMNQEEVELANAVSSTQKRLVELLTQKSLLEPKVQAFTAAEQQKVQVRAQLASLATQQFSGASTIEATNAQIVVEQASAQAELLQSQQLEREVKLLDAATVAFGPQGVVSLILDSFLEEFQAITTALCNEVTLGALQIRYDTEITLKKKSLDGKTQTRDKFDVIVEKTCGGEGVDLLSGSEGQKANLIIDQALSRLVASRSNVQINLRVYDEVFDSLSAVSCSMVAQVLSQPEPGIAKYVITHSQDLAGMFSKKLAIRMEKGVSRLVV